MSQISWNTMYTVKKVMLVFHFQKINTQICWFSKRRQLYEPYNLINARLDACFNTTIRNYIQPFTNFGQILSTIDICTVYLIFSHHYTSIRTPHYGLIGQPFHLTMHSPAVLALVTASCITINAIALMQHMQSEIPAGIECRRDTEK